MANRIFPNLSYAPTQSMVVDSPNEEYRALFQKQEKQYYQNRGLADLANQTLANLKVSTQDIQHKKAVEDKVNGIFASLEETQMWDKADEQVRNAANTIALDKPFKFAVEDYTRKEQSKNAVLARTDITNTQKLAAINEAAYNDKGIQPVYGDDGSILTYQTTYNQHNPAKFVDGAEYTMKFAEKAKADKWIGHYVYDSKKNTWRDSKDLVKDGDGVIRTDSTGNYVFSTEVTKMDKNELYSVLSSNLNQNPEWGAYVDSELHYVKDNDNSPANKANYLKILKSVGADTNDYKKLNATQLAQEIKRRTMVAGSVAGNAELFGFTSEEMKNFQMSAEALLAIKAAGAKGKTEEVPTANYLATYGETLTNPGNIPVDISNLKSVQSNYQSLIDRDKTTLQDISAKLDNAEKAGTDIKNINFLKRRKSELETQIEVNKIEKDNLQKYHDESLQEVVNEFNAKKAGSGDELANIYNGVYDIEKNKANPVINEIVDKVYDFYSKQDYKWYNVTAPSAIYDIPVKAFKDKRGVEEVKKQLRTNLIAGKFEAVGGFGGEATRLSPMQIVRSNSVGLDEKLVNSYNDYYNNLNAKKPDLAEFKDAINGKVKDFAESRQITPAIVDLSAGDGDKNSEYSNTSKYASQISQMYKNNPDGWVMLDEKTGKPISYNYETGISDLPIGEAVDMYGLTSEYIPGQGYMVAGKVYDVDIKDGKATRIPNSGKTKLFKPSSGVLSNIYSHGIEEAEKKGMFDYADQLREQKVDAALSYFKNYDLKPNSKVSTKYTLRNPVTKSIGNVLITREVDNSGNFSYIVNEDPANTKGLGAGGAKIGEERYSDLNQVERALEYVERASSTTGMRTDRHNNPIAASVVKGQTNSMTKALDAAGIKWGYGSSFKSGKQELSTINIINPNDAYKASAIMLMNGGKDWYTTPEYLAKTGGGAIEGLANFDNLNEDEQMQVIQQIAKREGSDLYSK